MYDFGLVGLGVMGHNFILNVADHNFTVCGLDVDQKKVDSLIAAGGNTEKVNATTEVETFVASLSAPRKIMLLIPAGKLVDRAIQNLQPYLEKGDIVIDGGNSYFTDTDLREAWLREKGVSFFGAGVSGGAEGARRGPSIMPGGNREAYEYIRPVFEAAAAKFKGEPCVTWLGPRSAGNYVKMIHNGIEYGLMQLISEVYDLLKKVGGLNNDDLSEAFGQWNNGRMQSFLIEITAGILRQSDDRGEGRLVDKILDKAKQKGTGKWTSQNAMDLGIPIPTIDVAVSMREISALKEMRVQADEMYDRPKPVATDQANLLTLAEEALYFSFIVTYAQGLHQLIEASDSYDYELDLAAVARIWRAGCIIRAALLDDISKAFEEKPDLRNILLSPPLAKKVGETIGSAREVIALGVKSGVPLAGLSSALNYFHAFTSGRLPLNLIQAQRDHFGAHTYERIDEEGIFHTEWNK